MKELVTKDFIIHYAPELQDFIERTVAHAEKKKKEFYKIFNCNENEIRRMILLKLLLFAKSKKEIKQKTSCSIDTKF